MTTSSNSVVTHLASCFLRYSTIPSILAMFLNPGFLHTHTQKDDQRNHQKFQGGEMLYFKTSLEIKPNRSRIIYGTLVPYSTPQVV